MAIVRLTEDYLIEHMWQTKPVEASWTMDLDREERPRNGKRPSAHVYFVDGVGKTMKEWAEASGISAKSIRSRLKAGCTFKDAITKPLMSVRPKVPKAFKAKSVKPLKPPKAPKPPKVRGERAIRRDTRLFEHNGQMKPASAWAQEHGVSVGALLRRLNKGMAVGDAVNAMKSDRSELFYVDGVGRTIKEWAEATGLKKASIYARLQYGWSIEAAIRLPASAVRGGRSHNRGWSKTSEKGAGTSGGGSPDSQPKQTFFLDAAE